MIKTGLISLVFAVGVFAHAAPEATVDVSLTPAGDFVGKTNEVKGFAVVSGGKVKAENIRVSLKNLKTGIELRDKHTQKHLETGKYPEAILVRGEGENGKGKGVIKIKGIEKEINGTYKIEGSEVAAQFKLKLSDFKITGIKYMGVGVDDEVTLKVRVPAKSGAAAAQGGGVRPANKKPASVRK